MKKLIVFSFATLLVASAFADPNEKVLRSFTETFSNARNVTWNEYADHYSVSFFYQNIRSRINYDKDGNILRSIRYYDPSQLPLSIFTRLKKEQGPSHKLFGVTEISENNETVYFVQVETERHWITLRVDEVGNSEIYEKFKKA